MGEAGSRMSATLHAETLSLQAPGANRRILRAAVLVSGGALLVKAAAVLKEVTLAGLFGRSDAMDAFVVASLLPALLVNLIAESMNQALAPTLVRVQETEGHARAQELLWSAMGWMCALMAVATGGLALGARGILPLLAWHFAPGKLALTIRLFEALLPLAFLAGIASNCTAVLSTQERFGLPALAPAVIPLTIVAGTCAGSGRLGIWALVWATLGGTLLHTMLMAGMMASRGYRLRLGWPGMTEPLREVARQYGPVMLSGAVASGGLLADQAMAAMLPAGSVSTLAYAGRFVSVALTLLAGAISTALTPYLSSMIARQDWAGCRHTLRTWTRLAALVSACVAVMLMAGAHGLVRVALQHGMFGARDTAAVTPVLALSALQIPFFVTSRVYYRFLVAMRRTDLVFYCGLINLVLDVALNLLLMDWWGVAGIALATSLWTMSTLLFLGYWAHRLLAQVEG